MPDHLTKAAYSTLVAEAIQLGIDGKNVADRRQAQEAVMHAANRAGGLAFALAAVDALSIVFTAVPGLDTVISGKMEGYITAQLELALQAE